MVAWKFLDRDFLLSFMLAIGAWIGLSPYFLWATNWVAIVPIFIAVIMIVVHHGGFSLNKVDAVSAFGVLFFIFYFYMPWWGNRASFNGAAFFMISLLVLYIYPSNLKLLSFLIYRRLFVLSLIPGMFLWMVYGLLGFSMDAFLVGTISENAMLNPMKSGANIFYYVYPGAVALNYMVDAQSPFYRMCAMYDEPGVVGTISALFLIAGGGRLSGWDNKVLLAAGLMSFSLAFFLLLFIYGILNSYKLARLILLFILLLLMGYLLFPIDWINEIDRLVLSRLQITQEGFVGDNRENYLFENQWQAWLNSSLIDLLFGNHEYLAPTGASSWKSILIQKGIIGFIGLMCILLLTSVRYYSGWPSICLSIAFMASIYQRPFVFTLPLMLLYIGGLSYLRHNFENTPYYYRS